jgi:uncharacterized protein (DUF1800 family)
MIESKHSSRYSNLLSWWFDLMYAENNDLANVAREKMVLFWHQHWCIEFNYESEAMIPPPLLYRNNQKLRRYRISDFKELVKEMTLDGAYLLYQSLGQSTAKAPNENYMRELMELFTMGIGNYSEGDIREGARALTGWRVSAHLGEPKPLEYFDTYFSPQDHDTNSKIIMGESIPARADLDNITDKVKYEEVYRLIDILFTRKGDAIARFICEKLYKYFVYASPSDLDRNFIDELALEMKNKNFVIRDVLIALFTSKHFFDTKYRGVQIKTPVELVINLQRQFEIKYSGSVAGISNNLEQSIYNPPNVSGWKGYRSWISTKTYSPRLGVAFQIVDQLSKGDIYSFVKKFEKYDVPLEFVKNVSAFFLSNPIDDLDRLAAYTNILLQNGKIDPKNWKTLIDQSDSSLKTGIVELFSRIIVAPDFELI